MMRVVALCRTREFFEPSRQVRIAVTFSFAVFSPGNY